MEFDDVSTFFYEATLDLAHEVKFGSSQNLI